jgi:hypothetical protein
MSRRTKHTKPVTSDWNPCGDRFGLSCSDALAFRKPEPSAGPALEDKAAAAAGAAAAAARGPGAAVPGPTSPQLVERAKPAREVRQVWRAEAGCCVLGQI